MRLKHFVIILSLIYAVVICGGLLMYRVGVVYPQMTASMLAMHQQDVRSVDKAFEAEKNHLRLLLNDWAKWDDAFEFMQAYDQGFVDSNLVPSTFTDANLHGVYFLRKDDSLAFGLELLESMGSLQAVAPTSKHLAVYAQVVKPSDEQSLCGYVWSHHVPELYCIASIQDSEQSQASNGYLLFSRMLDDSALDQLRAITKVAFEVQEVTPSGAEHEEGVLHAHLFDSVTELRDRYRVSLAGEDNADDLLLSIQYDAASLPKVMDALTWILLGLLMCIPLFLYWVINTLVVQPIASMSAFINAIGGSEAPPKLFQGGYIKEVAVFRKAVEALMNHVKNEHAALQQRSLTDALTGIKNRRAFDEQLPQLWNTLARMKKPAALIVIDIDFFKRYNDALGHSKGDQALQAVAMALRGVCRRSSDQIYRYGGEEFVITMMLERIEDLSLVLESLRKSVALLYFPHPATPLGNTLSISMGACLIEQPDVWMKTVDCKKAFDVADAALYEAKAAGRDTYVVHRLDE